MSLWRRRLPGGLSFASWFIGSLCFCSNRFSCLSFSVIALRAVPHTEQVSLRALHNVQCEEMLFRRFPVSVSSLAPCAMWNLWRTYLACTLHIIKQSHSPACIRGSTTCNAPGRNLSLPLPPLAPFWCFFSLLACPWQEVQSHHTQLSLESPRFNDLASGRHWDLPEKKFNPSSRSFREPQW